MFGPFGISIKLLEAFRHGIPVATTPDGAWGLPLRSGREIFIESDPAAFAERTIQLLTSPQTRTRMREAAYAYLAEHHALALAQAAVRDLVGLGLSAPDTSARTVPQPATVPA